MLRRSLTPQEISELNRYAVWLGRLSNSLNFMLNTVNTLPVTSQDGSKYTVQERNKMLRLALEDLKLELENVNHGIKGLQEEYGSIRQELIGEQMATSYTK